MGRSYDDWTDGIEETETKDLGDRTLLYNPSRRDEFLVSDIAVNLRGIQ